MTIECSRCGGNHMRVECPTLGVKVVAPGYDLQQRLDKAEWVLANSGFIRCDIAACNCGSWHQVGGYRARFDEIKEVVEAAGYSTNGRTLLDAVKAMAADKDAPVAVWMTDHGYATDHGDTLDDMLSELVAHVHADR